MEVLRIGAPNPSHEVTTGDVTDVHRTGAMTTLLHLARLDLPHDVRDSEITVSALFRASLMLNFLTGGEPQMTFSARAWRSGRTSRHRPTRLVWKLTTMIVDTACGMLRGEDRHCAAAWVNYVRRPRRPTTVVIYRLSSARTLIDGCGTEASLRPPDHDHRS